MTYPLAYIDGNNLCFYTSSLHIEYYLVPLNHLDGFTLWLQQPVSGNWDSEECFVVEGGSTVHFFDSTEDMGAEYPISSVLAVVQLAMSNPDASKEELSALLSDQGSL